MEAILPIPAFSDNYIWLIPGTEPGNVAIVDPGDADPVFAALEARGLRPVAVLCTHHHWDHVGGLPELRERYNIPVYGPRNEAIQGVDRPVAEGETVAPPELGLRFQVLEVPGHTRGHVAYFGHGLLFCGDTLFSAGCGRLFEGTAGQMHASLTRLAALPGDTRLYCAHEYTLGNLRFARAVEPDNAAIREHLDRCRALGREHRPTLPSTLALERRINPFLRVGEPAVRQAASAWAGRTLETEAEIFATVRRWKDGFRG